MSKVQFNLIPDVKLNYLKAQHNRKLVLKIAILVTAVCVGLFVIALLAVYGVQKKQLSDADKDIATATAKLEKIDSLEKIVTIQNQLVSLSTLHQQKVIASRVFVYLPQITPTDVFLGQVTIDFSANTMSISGTARSQKAVNTFIDTLKFTQYTVGQDEAKSAFSDVVESSFSVGLGNSYTVNLKFDPALFSSSKGTAEAPVLKVPTTTTTRSVIDDPANVLFNGRGQFKTNKTGTGR